MTHLVTVSPYQPYETMQAPTATAAGSVEFTSTDGGPFPQAARSQRIEVFDADGNRAMVVEVSGAAIELGHFPRRIYVVGFLSTIEFGDGEATGWKAGLALVTIRSEVEA